MSITAIAEPGESFGVSPEALEIAKTYLACSDTKETALALGIEPEKVTYYLRKPEVKRFIDTIFMEQGYMNRNKMQEVMDQLFEIKLEEMQETELGTSKDITELIALQLKMRDSISKENKEAAPVNNNTVQVTGQANFGSNYDNLLGKLLEAGKE